MASKQIKLSDIFDIMPDFINSESEDDYLCEKTILKNGKAYITITDRQSQELLYEELT